MAKRKPSGVYVRQTPDWFLSRCAIGGVFYISTVGMMSGIDLFNNANDGSNLHIYRLWVQNDAEGFYNVTRQVGSLGGTPVDPSPISARGAPLPGIISYADIPNFPAPVNGPIAFPGYIAGANDAGTMDIFEA